MADSGKPFTVMVQFPELPEGMGKFRRRVLARTMRRAVNLALDSLFSKPDSPIRQRVNHMTITVERLHVE